MATTSILIISKTILSIIAACTTNSSFWVTLLCLMLPFYMLIVRYFRYQRVNMIKKCYGFTDDLKSYEDMTPDQAQAVLKNLAEWDFSFVFEFGWISEFFKVRAHCEPTALSYSLASISLRLSLSCVQAYLEFSESVSAVLQSATFAWSFRSPLSLTVTLYTLDR